MPKGKSEEGARRVRVVNNSEQPWAVQVGPDKTDKVLLKPGDKTKLIPQSQMSAMLKSNGGLRRAFDEGHLKTG